MKSKKSSVLKYVAPAVAAYALLLCLLVLSERSRPDAQIVSLPGALWYSLVTLTTVGYGDMTPVSPVGRLIGGLFMLMSTGLLALLIGVIVSTVTGRLHPLLKLWLHRRDTWHVFSSESAAARALASRLEDGLIVFCNAGARSIDGALCVRTTPEQLLHAPHAKDGPRVLFAMDDDPAANERLATALKDLPVQIYCRSDGLDEHLPSNISAFSDDTCAARLYWQSRPWRVSGERGALIGNGCFPRALLTQGLLTAPPGCTLELFGDWSEWRHLHAALKDCPDMAIRLEFHPEPWHACREIIECADRLVLCDDTPELNRHALCQLRRWCVIQGEIHARCPRGLQEAWYFGEPDALFTPELVMRQALSARAMRLHELYRRSVDYPVPEWEALSEFLKRSNLAAADHLLTKIRLLLPEADVREITPETCRRAVQRYESAGQEMIERCRRIEHARWCLFHALYGWRYAPTRDNALRRHPMLVPYAQLDEAERHKDDNAWLLIGQLAKEEDH